MFKLLEIELRKLLPYRFFWLSVLAYAVLMPALFASLYKFNINVRGFEIGFSFYNFPEVWHNTTYIAGWFNFLLYVFVLQIVTNEYQFRTLRQNIIDGLSPWQALGGKILLLLLFALCSSVFVGLVALICGLTMSETHDQAKMFLHMEFLGYYFVQLLGYLSLGLLIGTLVRKSGMAVLAFSAYILIVEPVLRFRFLPAEIGPYLPSQTFGSLVANPLPSYLGLGKVAPLDPTMLAVSGGYILAFVVLSGLMVSRSDL